MKKFFAMALCLILVFCFAGCSEADKVNYNMSKQAQYFECERKITVYNARTDKVIFEAEGYAEDDLFYLAAAVCREAGGSSEEIQMLVANVVINRVNSPLFPNTIYSVLTQRKQYGTMWKYGVSFPEWATQSVKDQCYSVARRILNGERVCPANVVFQAEFKQGSGVYKEFDGFYFCYC